MVYAIVALLVLIWFTQVFTFWYSVRPVKETPDAPVKHVEMPDEPVDRELLTENELLRLEREAEFDLRIARMKDELAMRQPARPAQMTDATVMHPNVYNLPHNTIHDYTSDLPDVEYMS